MPYILNKTNGQQIAVVQDGSINSTTADLTFVGKNYSGYGQVVNENFLQLLENFASPTGPSKPVIGELWYDTANKKLNVNTNGTTSGWKKLALINPVESYFPVDQTIGDFYWDRSLQKLYVYNGTQHILIGPVGTGSTQASGAIVGTITSDSAIKNPVLLQQVAGDVPALVSGFSFVTNSQDGLYSKYPAVGAGITVRGTNRIGVSSDYLFWGTSSSSQGLVRKTENYSTIHTGDDYLLKSELAGIGGAINIQVDEGLYVGVNRIIKLHVTGNTVGNLSNIQSTRFNFNVTKNSTLTEIFHVDGGGTTNAILPNASASTNIGSTGAGNSFNKTYSTNLISATLTAPGATEPVTQPASGYGVITGNWTVNGQFSVASGASIAATTAGLATNAVNLQNATADGYIHAKTDASVNSILQLDGDGYANVRGISGSSSPKIKGTWTLDSAASLQASSLKNAAGDAYIGPTVSGATDTIKNTIVQRDGAGGITGVAIYGAYLQSPNLRAGAGATDNGTVYGNWILGTSASMQASGLAGTGGYFAASTDGAQANTIVQRDASKNVYVNDLHCAGDAYAGTFYGVATSAYYADLAEKYTSDSEYEAGTVLVIGGEKETTICVDRAVLNWAGVVSTNPAHLMNDGLEGVAIALSGRLPCKVVGPIKRGDLLVTSSTPGHAETYRDGDSTLAVIGKALENAPPGPGVIEIKV
jgi:hypothetical protein